MFPLLYDMPCPPLLLASKTFDMPVDQEQHCDILNHMNEVREAEHYMETDLG